MSFEILMIRYNIPTLITLRRASLRRSITNPPKGFVGITRCMWNFGVRISFHPYVRRILHASGLVLTQLSHKAQCYITCRMIGKQTPKFFSLRTSLWVKKTFKFSQKRILESQVTPKKPHSNNKIPRFRRKLSQNKS